MKAIRKYTQKNKIRDADFLHQEIEAISFGSMEPAAKIQGI
jgi:hypothetical protein